VTLAERVRLQDAVEVIPQLGAKRGRKDIGQEEAAIAVELAHPLADLRFVGGEQRGGHG